MPVYTSVGLFFQRISDKTKSSNKKKPEKNKENKWSQTQKNLRRPLLDRYINVYALFKHKYQLEKTIREKQQ